MKKIRPPFKMHGGKYYLAHWLISHFPEEYPDLMYLEPFCGAASTLFNKKHSKEESLNDLDPNIVRIMRVIRDQSEEFIKCLKKTKYTKDNFEIALGRVEFASDLDAAVNEFILRRMSRGGLKKAFAWSNRQRGGKPGDQNAWDTIIELMPDISDRLSGVFIFNKKATEVIAAYNNKDVLLYVDPPYVHDTRTSPEAYDMEMTQDDHIELANSLKSFKGKVILSGYPSSLYNRLYKGWRCEKKKIVNHSSQQKVKELKEEALWLNY